MGILKNSIADKKEFITEIYVDVTTEPVATCFNYTDNVCDSEVLSVEAAMLDFEKLGMDACWISEIKTYQVPQHYTADELA